MTEEKFEKTREQTRIKEKKYTEVANEQDKDSQKQKQKKNK